MNETHDPAPGVPYCVDSEQCEDRIHVVIVSQTETMRQAAIMDALAENLKQLVNKP